MWLRLSRTVGPDGADDILDATVYPIDNGKSKTESKA